MCDLATTPTKVDIEQRILYLQQALSSIRDASCNCGSKEISFFERQREIECAVQIAGKIMASSNIELKLQLFRSFFQNFKWELQGD